MLNIFIREPEKTTREIARFSKNNFYWGIVSQEEMQAFIKLAWEKGFVYAKKHYQFTSRFDYADEYSRGDFHFLLPVSQDATILDLGSGYGNVTIPLARYYKNVVAADASLELLEFSQVRALAEGLSTIHYVHIDPLYTLNLPFKERSFDAIILNGVLEWSAHGSDADDPQRVQEQLLSQLHRLLKDDGVLCVGIENRLFPGWLSRDPHSKLKWTSVMPRRVADWYARRHGFTKGYQTYIYSRSGYQRLMRAAGFAHMKFYYPFPSYRLAPYVYSDDRSVRAFVLRTLIQEIYTRKWALFIRALAPFRLDRTFLSSFIIMATKRKDHDMAPSLVRLARASGVPDVAANDRVVKVVGKGEGDSVATFLAFHEEGREPYGALSVVRNPSNETPRKIILSDVQ